MDFSPCVICPHCGCQVEDMQRNEAPQQIVINNTNQNSNQNTNQNVNAIAGTRLKSKWVAILLCLFGGYFGAHKFYEGRMLAGILYLFTGGLFLIGAVLDFLALLGKPDPYVVM